MLIPLDRPSMYAAAKRCAGVRSSVLVSAVPPASALASNGLRSCSRPGGGKRSAAFQLAMTLKPPVAAFSTLRTRSGDRSFGRGEKPAAVTSRSRPAV